MISLSSFTFNSDLISPGSDTDNSSIFKNQSLIRTTFVHFDMSHKTDDNRDTESLIKPLDKHLLIAQHLNPIHVQSVIKYLDCLQLIHEAIRNQLPVDKTPLCFRINTDLEFSKKGPGFKEIQITESLQWNEHHITDNSLPAVIFHHLI